MTLSVQDIEHIDRDAVSTTYKISGPSQKRPAGWTVALKNSSFIISCKKLILYHLFYGKFLYANSKDTCYKFESQDDKVLCTEQVNYCNHEQADSRMFYDLSLVATSSNVVMRTNDADSLVIAMRCRVFSDTSLKLWLKVGTQ